jgi:hypothetical protein
MSVSFYDLLQVPPDATPDAIRGAYQEQIAQVVRKLRAAEARQQDVSGIEARRGALAEAWAVLSDPTRRRRYDRFRELSRQGLPADPEALWAQAGPSLVDPAAAAAVEVVRTLTDLRLGEPIGLAAPVPADPEIGSVQVRGGEPARESGRVELRLPTPRIDMRDAPRADTSRPDTSRSDAARPEPVRVEAFDEEPLPVTPELLPNDAPPAPASRTPAAPSRVPAGPPPLPLDRNVSSEDLARLFDHYGPTGAFLRAVRETRRITLQNLSANTRISLRFLDAMERDAYTDLPGATFVRGYLKMVVRALEAIPAGPEMDEFAEGYMSRYHRARG